MKVNANVKGLPNYPLQRFIVCRLLSGVCWFYGTWDDEERAYEVANEFGNGCVFEILD